MRVTYSLKRSNRAYPTVELPSLCARIYSAWVLILQLGAFVSFLDLGIQTGVSKFVAEHDARGDVVEAGSHASGFVMMTLASFLGLGLTAILAWQVSKLFHNMPEALYRDVRISVLLVGASLSFTLLCSVFSTVLSDFSNTVYPLRSRSSIAVCTRLPSASWFITMEV
jgi:O-antigen/teichoic acid export membrane protein